MSKKINSNKLNLIGLVWFNFVISFLTNSYQINLIKIELIWFGLLGWSKKQIIIFLKFFYSYNNNNSIKFDYGILTMVYINKFLKQN